MSISPLKQIKAKFKQILKNVFFYLQRVGIKKIPTQIKEQLPHDHSAFTQGLAYRAPYLYESTGLDDASSLRKLDAKTGKLQQKIAVTNSWAEGIALAGTQIIQLTWHDGIARVFNHDSLELETQRHYQGEGWGLTDAPNGLIMSNGSSTLRFLDTEFNLQKELRVTMNGLPVKHINDICYAQSLILCNIWYREEVLIISPVSGKVIAILDTSQLKELAKVYHPDAVQNGIAYNAQDNLLYLTGKHWPVIFTVSFPDKGLYQSD